MDIYLFSNCSPAAEMIKDLGGKITTRFKGNISDIHYCRLLQIHQISVVTSEWCSSKANPQDKSEKQITEGYERQQEKVIDSRKIQNRQNLFGLLKWNQAKPVIFH